MTPLQWNELLAPGKHHTQCYPEAAKMVRAFLAKNPLMDGQIIGTAELVEQLYPLAYARGDGIESRRRLFSVLRYESKPGGILADCFDRGEPVMSKGLHKMIRPFLWHAPTPVLCPHCGGEL